MKVSRIETEASVTQVENAEKPFIALLIKPPEVGRHGGGWAIENEGTAPAINIRHSDPRGGGQLRESVRALGRGAFFIFDGFDFESVHDAMKRECRLSSAFF